MADHEDVHALRRRGRRRLVGAIALVLLAVIVLPMVLDSEPPAAPPLSVRIPAEDDSTFAPRAAQKAPAAPVPQPQGEAAAPAEKREAKAEAEPKPAGGAEAPAPKRSASTLAVKVGDPAGPKADPAMQPARAQKAPAATGRFVVQIGAFQDGEKVREISARLSAAGLPHYTEAVPVASGTAMRVRVGPYASREAADDALKKVQALGFAASKLVGPSP